MAGDEQVTQLQEELTSLKLTVAEVLVLVFASQLASQWLWDRPSCFAALVHRLGTLPTRD